MDIYHAREHLHALAAGLTSVLVEQHPDWLAARLADLDAGDIETLVTQTNRLAPTGDAAHQTAKALAYFKTNAHRMRYTYFRDHGMFIGSGTVEAGCKTIIGHNAAPTVPTPQTVRHALEHPRRHRHPHPALPASQQPLGTHLDTARTTRPHRLTNLKTGPESRSTNAYLQI